MATSQEMLRALPSVDALCRSAGDVRVQGRAIPQTTLTRAAREVLDATRRALLNGQAEAPPTHDSLVEAVVAAADRLLSSRLPIVINATGVIVHTGLGRAPMAPAAVKAAADAASRYVPVEFNIDSGDRGKRSHLVRDLLCELTGAESATVVNNTAAALMLTLGALAQDRSVVVARGELIEIGGSFRLPEVMRAGGAILREVGTTNRVRLKDYESAIGPSTAALMKVHTSNYRVEGFVESVPRAKLAELAHSRGVLLFDDIGSGLLRPHDHPALRGEPDASTALSDGADIVMFSGDKLLSGPQAGIILGRRDLIERIERHPMMRAVRVDKIVLAALGATLRCYFDPHEVIESVPVFAMLHADEAALRVRARTIAERCSTAGLSVEVVDTDAYVGGGSVPTQAFPSVGLRLKHAAGGEEALARALRLGEPAVIARRQDGAVWCDLRTVFPEQDESLAAAIRHAAAVVSSEKSS